VRAEALSGAERGEPVEADAIVSAMAGLAVGIVTADCVPILVASRDGSRVGAIHAGWRGLAAGVIEAGIEAMDCDASGLAAAVGPAARFAR
jgi:copper oxidase (laccase) domain-containing protein